MLSINTNLSSLIIQNSLKTSTQKLNQAVERMSTGFKINHAKDNAAGYSIITDMNTKISAYQVAEENTAMSLDLITTASDSLDLISNNLTRLRTLVEQSLNGTYAQSSQSSINKEANAIIDEIQRTHRTTSFNDIKLYEKENHFIQEVTRRDTSAMTKLAGVSETTILAKGTYSISSAEELEKLGRLAKNGKLADGSEFVLANNLDLSIYSLYAGWAPIKGFSGTFDGNGYVISNLYIALPTIDEVGLFCESSGDTVNIKNLGVENANVTGNDITGIIAGRARQISNCYSTGSVNGGNNVGGVAGCAKFTNCYSSADVRGVDDVGGIVGYEAGSASSMEIASNNSYFTGCVQGVNQVGGIAGSIRFIRDCYSTGNVYGSTSVGSVAGSCDTAKNCYATGNVNNSMVNLNNISGINSRLIDCNVYSSISKNIPYTLENSVSTTIRSFQIGINGNEQAKIDCDTGIALSGLGILRDIGNVQNDYYLDILDNIIEKVNAKQTTYGATQNRLLSALDEISTQYENLVSSRSTLRDADISKTSAEYIKHQILQQASATLLASANQSPALALQLI